MAEGLEHAARSAGTALSSPRTKGLVWGMVASLIATILIDLLMMGSMVFQGLPAEAGFAVIGDTAAGFFARFGLNVPASVLPGLAWHYMIGLGIGALFGVSVTWIHALRLDSLKKGVGLGIVYTEFISLPILVLPSIILSWSASETVESLGFFFSMHVVWGLVLGLVVTYGLRSTQGESNG